MFNIGKAVFCDPSTGDVSSAVSGSQNILFPSGPINKCKLHHVTVPWVYADRTQHK